MCMGTEYIPNKKTGGRGWNEPFIKTRAFQYIEKLGLVIESLDLHTCKFDFRNADFFSHKISHFKHSTQ